MTTYHSHIDYGSVVTLRRVNFHRECHVEDACPNCGRPTSVIKALGRWDPERQATAIPFEPVWVRLWCSCEFGDESASRPADGGAA